MKNQKILEFKKIQYLFDNINADTPVKVIALQFWNKSVRDGI